MIKTLKTSLFYLLLFYAIVGFFILPYYLKPKLCEIFEQETNAKIEIQSIYINPFLLKLELSGVVLKDLKGKEILSFKEFFADLEFYSLVQGVVHFKNISLKEPKVSLVYNADKTFNVLNILKEQEAPLEDENSSIELPRIKVESLRLKGGSLHYEDYTLRTPFAFNFTNIGFFLSDVDTDETEPLDASLRFYTTLGDGGFVDFRSKISSLASLKAKGSIDFEASKLYTQWKYVQDILNLEVADGKISFSSEYAFDLADINATSIENLTLHVEKLRIKPKNEPKDIFNIEKLSLIDVNIYPLKEEASVKKVKLDGLSVLAKRDKLGEIDWVEYVALNIEDDKETPKKESNATKETNATKEWQLSVNDIALERIAVKFEDSSVSPSVTTDINRVDFYAKGATLAGEEPFTYKMNLQLNKSGICRSEGSVAHKNLNVESFLECQALDVVHYNPYIVKEAQKALKSYNINLKQAALNFHADAKIEQNAEQIDAYISNASIGVNRLKLSKKNHKSNLVEFSNFLISGIDANTTAKSIEIQKAMLNSLNVDIQKYKNSTLNLDNLVVPKVVKKSAKAQKKSQEEPYSVSLKHFALNGSSLKFSDASLATKAVNRLRNINANLYDIDLKEKSWLRYEIGMYVNAKGELKSQGKLRHTPLAHSGDFEIKNISLEALNPYIQESAFVSIEDGALSLKGESNYSKNEAEPDLRVEGSLQLNSFFLHETLQDSQIFSLNELDVKSYTFELQPNRIFIDEVDVNAFYIDASIDKNATLNFSKLLKKQEGKDEEKNENQEQTSSTPFPYRLVKINVDSGSAKFSDYSIPIMFSTHIHDLSGSIYSISNSVGDTAYIDLVGEVDKYGATKLKGSVDSANVKAYTDLALSFENLGLNAYSGYSASFAGHEIESGKFSLDLGYKIDNSQLQGSNSVVIRKIKLGQEYKDENVTVLPLGFVIGLLEDSDGVIDIDMPVEGDLDSPEFKYGTLIFKTFTNLITKAVVSPFKFLASAMGIKGEDLEFVAFEPASSEITPPQREKLDKVAMLMKKKPKISLGIPATYDKEYDTQALAHAKLVDLVVQKSGIKNREEYKSVMNISMLEEIYEEQKGAKPLKDIRNKIRQCYSDDDKFQRAYESELQVACQELQEISKLQLSELADKRAQNIMNYFLQEKGLFSERINLKELQVSSGSAQELVEVNMEIEVK